MLELFYKEKGFIMKRLLIFLFVLGVGFADNNVSPNTKVLEKGSIEWYQKNLAEAKTEFDRNVARSGIARLEAEEVHNQQSIAALNRMETEKQERKGITMSMPKSSALETLTIIIFIVFSLFLFINKIIQRKTV